jgi:hypothetical protein
MTPVFIVSAGFVGHAVGNFLHVENGLIEFSHPIPILGHDSNVSNACKHDHGPPN